MSDFHDPLHDERHEARCARASDIGAEVDRPGPDDIADDQQVSVEAFYRLWLAENPQTNDDTPEVF